MSRVVWKLRDDLEVRAGDGAIELRTMLEHRHQGRVTNVLAQGLKLSPAESSLLRTLLERAEAELARGRVGEGEPR